MTRGALALVHGDVFASLALNPGMVVLVLVAITAGVVVIRGRPLPTLPMWLPFAVVATLWSFQLFKYATGRPL
jgi:Protein of unknown function (DUF2752)